MDTTGATNIQVEPLIADKPKMINSLSGFRVIACLLVAFSHFEIPTSVNSSISKIAFKGYSGVTAFIILSGFVLTWNQLTKGNKEVPNNKIFYIDRISKIYPLHIATFLLSLFLIGIPVFTALDLIPNLTLTQAWLPSLSHVYIFNSVSWALSVEIFLYFCFPYLYRSCSKLFEKYSIKSVIVMITAGLLIPIAGFCFTTFSGKNKLPIEKIWSAHYFLYRLPLIRVGDFIVGIGLAFLVYYSKPIRKEMALALQIITIGLYLLAANQQFTFESTKGALSFDLLWLPIFSLAIYSLAIQSTTPNKNILSTRFFATLGTWSFAFYLLHEQVYIFLMNHGYSKYFDTNLRYTIFISLLLLGITVLSFVAHNYFEQPSLKLIRKYIKR